MNRFVASILGILLGTTAVSAQGLARLYTTPALPPREALDRLHLTMAWYTYLPTDGRRDGINRVQITDYASSQQIFVQTRSGTILALDGATGASLWRVRLGLPYVVSQPLGYNSNTVFAIYGASLFALARDTGQLLWEFSLPHTAASAPVADEERVYVTLATGRLQAYLLPKTGTKAPESLPGPEPKPEPAPAAPAEPPAGPPKLPTRSDYKQQLTALGVSGRSLQSISAVSSLGQSVRSIGPLASAAQAGQKLVDGPQPLLLWEYESDTRLQSAPLLTTDFVFLVSGGTFNAVAKPDSRLLYRFPSGLDLSAPLGQYGETAYVSSSDFGLHAFDIFAGRILWRFLGGGPILRTPAATDEDVYVTAERAGLYRLDRGTGLADWQNTSAERFVAANKKVVYATDASGRLLILDRTRGRRLGTYAGTRDFVVPISNELTDRLYLASNDGLLLCLHDRDYPTPLRMRTVEERKPTPAPAEAIKAPPEKEEMKKPEKGLEKIKKPDNAKATGDEKKSEK
jgi:outer membrane protein assembly factor BamB